MKKSINLGARGWRNRHWLNTFYPEDLPEDWQLTYYSNVFNTVLVPADYWQMLAVDCEDWRDNVHDDFSFFIECHAGMFDYVSLEVLSAQLQNLLPQLSGLVFLAPDQSLSTREKEQFKELIDVIAVDVYGIDDAAGVDFYADSKPVWRQTDSQTTVSSSLQPADFAVFDDALSDMKCARAIVESFVATFDNSVNNTDDIAGQNAQATIIVDHPQLQAESLSKFRSVLEIMGY